MSLYRKLIQANISKQFTWYMVGQRDFFLEIRTENAELNFFNQTAKRNELKKRNDFRGLKHQRYGIFD